MEEQNNRREGTAQAVTLIFLFVVVLVGYALLAESLASPEGRQWAFKSDMNGDGIYTIRDVWAIAVWLFFYPGDLLIYFLLHHMEWLANMLRGASEFLEVSAIGYGGIVSFLVSLVAWPALVLLLYAAASRLVGADI